MKDHICVMFVCHSQDLGQKKMFFNISNSQVKEDVFQLITNAFFSVTSKFLLTHSSSDMWFFESILTILKLTTYRYNTYRML